MKRFAITAAGAVLLAGAVVLLPLIFSIRPGQSDGRDGGSAGATPQRQAEVLFAEDFDSWCLGTGRWTVTLQHDFGELFIGTVPEDRGGPGDRLCLRCGTRGTDGQTVKSLGLVTHEPLDLSGQKTLSLEFDWNDQDNGCYLTGAIYLCPSFTTGDPADERQWLKLEYVGVPPGRNARAAVWLKTGDTPRWVYDEAWPDSQHTGRPVGEERVDIAFAEGQWAISEDGRELVASGEGAALPFERAHLYLQMTSHSNYPPREIYFDDVSLTCRRPTFTEDVN